MNISQLRQGHQRGTPFWLLKLTDHACPTILTGIYVLAWGLGWTSQRRTRLRGWGNRGKEGLRGADSSLRRWLPEAIRNKEKKTPATPMPSGWNVCTCSLNQLACAGLVR